MPFPPLMSEERQKGYKQNLLRFDGDYNKNNYIYVKNLQGTVDKYRVATENFYKLITLKLQGLLLNEKPIITVKDNAEKTKLLNDLVNNSGFWLAFQQSFRNFSSLGTGALYLYKQGVPKVNPLNPQFLYKVVNSTDISEVKCYVLAQPIVSIDYKNPEKSKTTHIRMLYHYKGYYIEKVYEYKESKGVLGQVVAQDFVDYKVSSTGLRVDTGLEDFAVFTFENQPSANSIYGTSDYNQIADVVSIYEQILTLVNIVIVKNINPIIQVPAGLMHENEQTGQLEFNGVGSAVEVRKDEKDIKYISYDMQVTDIMNYIDRLLSEIGIQSEMSKTFLTGDFASNLSGEAIKNLIKSPLDKISRSIDTLDSVVKGLFSQMLLLQGIEDIDISDVEIEWKDGIATTED